MNIEEILLKLSELDKSSQQVDTPESERLETVEIVNNFANQFTALDSVKAFQQKEATSLEITDQKKPLKEPSFKEIYERFFLY